MSSERWAIEDHRADRNDLHLCESSGETLPIEDTWAGMSMGFERLDCARCPSCGREVRVYAE
jgi:hypothetical protein